MPYETPAGRTRLALSYNDLDFDVLEVYSVDTLGAHPNLYVSQNLFITVSTFPLKLLADIKDDLTFICRIDRA